MKPKPFASLNHFTVPCSIAFVFPELNCAGGFGATPGRILLGWASAANARFGSNADRSVAFQHKKECEKSCPECRIFRIFLWNLLNWNALIMRSSRVTVRRYYDTRSCPRFALARHPVAGGAVLL